KGPEAATAYPGTRPAKCSRIVGLRPSPRHPIRSGDSLMDHATPRFPAALRLFLVAFALLLIARPTPAHAVFTPTPNEIADLNAAAADTARAREVVQRTRAWLGSDLDPAYVPYIRSMLLDALITSHARPTEIVAVADSSADGLGKDTRTGVLF